LQRRWLIAAVLVVIFAVAVAAGVFVASWPHCCRL
jgi:hypothetical protein